MSQSCESLASQRRVPCTPSCKAHPCVFSCAATLAQCNTRSSLVRQLVPLQLRFVDAGGRAVHQTVALRPQERMDVILWGIELTFDVDHSRRNVLLSRSRMNALGPYQEVRVVAFRAGVHVLVHVVLSLLGGAAGEFPIAAAGFHISAQRHVGGRVKQLFDLCGADGEVVLVVVQRALLQEQVSARHCLQSLVHVWTPCYAVHSSTTAAVVNLFLEDHTRDAAPRNSAQAIGLFDHVGLVLLPRPLVAGLNRHRSNFKAVFLVKDFVITGPLTAVHVPLRFVVGIVRLVVHSLRMASPAIHCFCRTGMEVAVLDVLVARHMCSPVQLQ